MNVQNKKARFKYEILDTLIVGLVLTGTETKSIKAGNISISEAYLTIQGEELFLINANVSPYSHGNIANPDPTRTRKCLAKKSQILYLKKQLEQKGLTLVPLKIFTKERWIKCEIGIGKGKKAHDKREDLKKKDLRREAQAALRKKGT